MGGKGSDVRHAVHGVEGSRDVGTGCRDGKQLGPERYTLES